MTTPLVELTIAHGVMEAELIRSVLHESGIDCQLLGSGAISSFGFTAGPLSEIPIYVAPDRLAEALEIVQTISWEDSEETEDSEE